MGKEANHTNVVVHKDDNSSHFFESQSQQKQVGRKALRSGREVFLFHVFILLFSFLLGTLIFSHWGESKAATQVETSGGGTLSRPFSTDSLWNTPIPSGTSWSTNSKLSSGHYWVNNEDYSIPVVVGTSSDPLVNVTVPASWGWSGGVKQVHVPIGITGANGTDGTLIVISDNVAHNFWQFNRTSNTVATAESYAAANIVTDSGFGTSNPFKAAGIRAAGSSALAGLINGYDISSGKIDHALAVSLLPTLLKSGWVYPAIAEDGGNSYSGTIPMGSRLGIPSGTAMPSGLSNIGKMVWNALQTYGAFVVDQNYGDSPVIFYADPFSVDPSSIDPLRIWWSGGSDLDKIMPYIRFTSNNSISPSPSPSPTPPPPPPAAPVVTISASPSSLQSGNSSTISWSATNSPTSCTASGDWNGSKPASGTASTGTLSSVKTYTYTLSCSNSGGTGSKSTSVIVSATPPPAPSPPVISMAVSPATINQGNSSTISWSATNSPTSCTASGDWNGSKPASGTASTGTLQDVRSYTFNLSCVNAGGTTNGSVALIVVPAKPVITISASPSTVKIGNSSTISWSATNSPTSCTASGDWNGSKPASGTASTGSLSEKKTYNYTLTCTNSGGSGSSSIAVTANASGFSKGPKPKVNLTVSPSVIQLGQEATLTWSVEGEADLCKASDGWSGSKPASGTENVTPEEEGQTYTITCENENGGESASTAVSVANVKDDGTVTVNKTPVKEIKVDNPAIVGESKSGEQPTTEDANKTSKASVVSKIEAGPLSTTKGKIVAAGTFAGIITLASAGFFAASHYLHWQFTLPFRWPWGRGPGVGPGGTLPPGMISG